MVDVFQIPRYVSSYLSWPTSCPKFKRMFTAPDSKSTDTATQMLSCEFPKFLKTPYFIEQLRQLLRQQRCYVYMMFKLAEKFSQGILVCTLLSLFSVENNAVESIWKTKFMNLMSMHLFRRQCFYNSYKLVVFINPSLMNTRRLSKFGRT